MSVKIVLWLNDRKYPVDIYRDATPVVSPILNTMTQAINKFTTSFSLAAMDGNWRANLVRFFVFNARS